MGRSDSTNDSLTLKQEAPIQVLRLTDADAAFEILSRLNEENESNEGQFYWQDNGGDPDGNEWLQESANFNQNEIDALVAARVAELRQAHVIDYCRDEETNEYPRDTLDEEPTGWCGYQINRTAYLLIEETN